MVIGSAAVCTAYFLNQPVNVAGPSSLSLHERAGQLTINWNPIVTAHGGTLEIVDGPRRTTVTIAEPLAGVTYAADSADVQIRLTPVGAGQVETARYLVQEQPLAMLDSQFSTALAEAYALHTVILRQDKQITNLESSARALAKRTQTRPRPRPAPTVTRWWR